MKIYEPTSKSKSWSIDLGYDPYGNASLQAVDAKTGEYICYLIMFEPGGRVRVPYQAKQTLASSGYAPEEHGNSWYDDGRLVITGVGE